MNSNNIEKKPEIKQYIQSHHLKKEMGDVSKVLYHNKYDAIAIHIRDEKHRILFNKYRIFGLKDGSKYRYDKGTKTSLYGVHKITENTHTIIFMEGEFDAMVYNYYNNNNNNNNSNNADDTGIVAVSSTGGAGSFCEEWLEYTKGRDVIILYDNDEPGIVGAVRLLTKLNYKARVMRYTNNHFGTDIKDYCDYYGVHGNTPIESEQFTETVFQSSLEVKTKKELNQIVTVLSAQNRSKNPYIKHILNEVQKNIKSNTVDRKARAMMLQAQNGNQNQTGKNTSIVSLDMIRRVPITNYLTFTNKSCKCIFHNDKRPSLMYNDFNSRIPNTVKCFACGKFGSVIDVVMALHNTDFKGAVEIIKGDNNFI